MANQDLIPFRPSTSELLCTPFLDTDMPHEVKKADEELSRRGYPRWAVSFLRRIFAVGLWTQSFVWEEFHLDWADVSFGYGLIFCGLSVPLLFLTGIANSITPVKLAGASFLFGSFLISLGFLGWRSFRKNTTGVSSRIVASQ